MKKILFLAAFALIFSACGGSVKPAEVDTKTQEADGLVFYGKQLLGIWTIYEYDEDEKPKKNGLGIDIRYQFESGKKISQNITLINQWIPLGLYEVKSNILSFQEGSNEAEFEAIEEKDDGCLKIGKTRIKDNNPEFDKYYHFCKTN